MAAAKLFEDDRCHNWVHPEPLKDVHCVDFVARVVGACSRTWSALPLPRVSAPLRCLLHSCGASLPPHVEPGARCWLWDSPLPSWRKLYHPVATGGQSRGWQAVTPRLSLRPLLCLKHRRPRPYRKWVRCVMPRPSLSLPSREPSSAILRQRASPVLHCPDFLPSAEGHAAPTRRLCQTRKMCQMLAGMMGRAQAGRCPHFQTRAKAPSYVGVLAHHARQCGRHRDHAWSPVPGQVSGKRAEPWCAASARAPRRASAGDGQQNRQLPPGATAAVVAAAAAVRSASSTLSARESWRR